MPHTDKTLLLNDEWDLEIGEDGNLKTITGSLATAQNCANEIRLWRNDAYFQKEKGIPWLDVQLAQKVGSSLFPASVREACLNVAGVKSVDSVEVNEFDPISRELKGSVKITTKDEENVTVNF